MEKFLNFWSHYNATIIEVLVALILLSTIYLVYRTFFGSKGADSLAASEGGSVGVNTAHIEKTLQKILEQQATLKSSSSDAAAAALALKGDAASLEMVQELATLKKALEEKEKQIQVLQEKAAEAAKAAAAPGAGPSEEAIAAAASAAAGLAEKERADYEAKIKELEARLAEYEIISEDIADLSFFKEENARLTKELEALRGEGGTGAAAAAPAPAEPAASAPESALAPAAAEPAASAEAPTAEAAPAPEPAPAASPEASGDAASAIDDSIMAEFAKAVEGQKAATAQEAPKADENSKLLEEFENFNKKS